MESALLFNQNLFEKLNTAFGAHTLLDSLVLFFAEYYVVFLVLLALSFIYRDYRSFGRHTFRLHLLGVILILSLVSVSTYLIRFFYPYPRPFLLYDINHLAIQSLYSFPSAHTILIFGLASGMYVYNKRFAYFLIGSGFLVGISRIIAGVHYPLDILGGAVLGLGIGFVVEWGLRPFFRRN